MHLIDIALSLLCDRFSHHRAKHFIAKLWMNYNFERSKSIFPLLITSSQAKVSELCTFLRFWSARILKFSRWIFYREAELAPRLSIAFSKNIHYLALTSLSITLTKVSISRISMKAENHRFMCFRSYTDDRSKEIQSV